MREPGFVTLWLGHAQSAEALERYVRLQFTEDGDLIPSRLMRDFSIPSYDEDFREAELLSKPQRSLEALLRGFSYDSQLVEKFRAICGETINFDANAVVLLYNFRTEQPRVGRVQAEDVELQWIGTTEYVA
jgi:hypothetical protein